MELLCRRLATCFGLATGSNRTGCFSTEASRQPQYLGTNFPKDEDGRTYHVGTKVSWRRACGCDSDYILAAMLPHLPMINTWYGVPSVLLSA